MTVRQLFVAITIFMDGGFDYRVVAWHLGKRDRVNTEDFISKVRWATSADRWFDVSTDAFAPYENAIDAGLHDRATDSQVVKLFSHHIEPGRERYSPAKFITLAKDAISGTPDLAPSAGSNPTAFRR